MTTGFGKVCYEGSHRNDQNYGLFYIYCLCLLLYFVFNILS